MSFLESAFWAFFTIVLFVMITAAIYKTLK